jgi:hypothetical protein
LEGRRRIVLLASPCKGAVSPPSTYIPRTLNIAVADNSKTLDSRIFNTFIMSGTKEAGHLFNIWTYDKTGSTKLTNHITGAAPNSDYNEQTATLGDIRTLLVKVKEGEKLDSKK